MRKIIRKIIPYSIRNKVVNRNIGKTIDIYKQNPKKLNGKLKKVSVIIPNYNYETFIEERIDSIIKQTYPIYELIILDDNSTDNSVKKIKEIIKKYEKNIKIQLDINEKNSGSVFSQWQKGFQIAKGDYIWIAEADDSCSPYFLENVMKGFEDKTVVLSYAESMRIDENNRIISTSCRDWMAGINDTRWKKSYIHSSEIEIKEALSVCNTIPNVSAVVFKKANQVQLIEEAKQFSISGDWYLYYKLLQGHSIAYCHKSLNYFRKHNKSTSTIAKKEVELEELLKIQQDIRQHYQLTSEQLLKQTYRYGNLSKEVDSKFLEKVQHMMVKKIAWIIPHPIKGSGGIRTMIQNANFLSNSGFLCDIYVEEDYMNDSDTMKRRIQDYYGQCNCNVYVGIALRMEYDLIFATYSILTADYVRHIDHVKHKAYFIQDYEPWFEPMGGTYLDMERTYRYGLQGISIGNWLAQKINSEYDMPMASFPFCADLKVYRKLENIQKEKALCFIYQPEKSRRCSKLGFEAITLVKKLRPDVKIYIYGSSADIALDYEVENLHIIPIEKCNELYNRCTVGLCISASNPSRIPFEMMAAGLPVVDLYRENNLYDIPTDGVLLADTTPEAIATALIQILDDEKLQEKMSKVGIQYMKDYPLERGYQDFLKTVNQILEGKTIVDIKKELLYKKAPVRASQEVLDINYWIRPIPIPCSPTGKKMRFLVRLKRFIIRKLKGQE